MKIEYRSLFNKFFGSKPADIPGATQIQLVNSLLPYFYNFDGNIYDSDIVRSCIHAIASNAAKFDPKHKIKGLSQGKTSAIERLLSLRPNKYMSSYDYIYKIVSLLYTSNNVFIYIRYVDGKLEGLYPINYTSVQLLEYQNEIYVKFMFLTGQMVTIPLSELIHLRRHFNRNDMFGEDALLPLKPSLSVASVQNQGIMHAIKSTAGIRGIIKITGVLNQKDLKEYKDNFVKDYLNISNNGGVAATDGKADYINIDSKPIVADDKQLAFARDTIYRYFNISEKIITSNYTEAEYNAFYSSVLEPLGIQLSQSHTYGLFSDREIGFENEIEFNSDRITFASLETKRKLIKDLIPLAVLSINQAKEILDLPAIPGGDKHIMSLNYVDYDKANKYQLGEDNDDQNDSDNGQANQDG